MSPLVGKRMYIAVILSIFGDESSDETKQRVFAVSGVFGNKAEWALTEEAWLKRTSGTVFHAADCEYEKNFELYKDLTQILASGYVAGVSIALDLTVFREFFPDALADVGYYQCFTKVIAGHARTAREWNARVAANPECGDPLVELEFTFDHRIESEQNAGRLYSTFINQPEWRNSAILDGKISFESRKNPRIQMADLVAREAMKDLDREVGPVKFPRRKSMLALAANDHFKFVKLDRDYCEQLKSGMAQLELETGFNREGYLQWLQDTGRVQNGHLHDNWYNRAMYLAWLDNRAI